MNRRFVWLVGLLCGYAASASAEPFEPVRLPDFENDYDHVAIAPADPAESAAVESFAPPAFAAAYEVEPASAARDLAAVQAVWHAVPTSKHSVECCGDGPCGWNAGAGVYFVQPRFSSNPALFTGDIVPTALNQRDFTWDLQTAPFIWVGYTGTQGTGVRAQWFGLDGQSNDVSATNDFVDTFVLISPVIGNVVSGSAFPDDVMTTRSSLALNVIDFEMSKAFQYRRGSYVASAGLRYAYLRQTYDSTITDAGGVLIESLSAGHNQATLGPTVALSARYPTRFLPRLGFYGRARGAVLFGQRHQRVILDPPAFFGLSEFNAAGDVTVPMSELEAGLDWTRPVGRAGFFLQTGVVAQTWFGVGNAAASTTSTLIPGGFISTTDTGNLSLLGLRLTAGFQF